MEIRPSATVIMLSALLLAIAVPAMHAGAQVEDPAMDLAATCPVKEGHFSLEERPAFLANVPTGIAVTALARQQAEQLPQGIEFTLSLDRLTLAAKKATKQRITDGPTLFLVEDGTVAVIDNGRPMQPTGHLGSMPGESVLVEQDHFVWLENDGQDPASILVLGLLPPEGLLPIGPFGQPASIWIPFPGEEEQLTHRQMLSGAVGALAREETLLFAACLHWNDLVSEVAPMQYPGPVGFLVLRGQVEVNESERVGSGGCWLSPSFTSLRLRAVQQGADIIFFGALKTSVQPRLGAGGSESPDSMECSGPTATG